MTAQFQISSPASEAEFEEYFLLRWQVLRAYHNLPRGSERDEIDEDGAAADHVTVRDSGGQLLGVGRLHILSPAEAQIRYMAVREDSRAAGVGRALVTQLEKLARGRQVQRIVLNAREEVVGFYERLGFHRAGDGPTLFSEVKHVRMEKDL